MHSRGVYGKFMAYENDEVDRLCEAGIATVQPAKREEIYTRLQHLWFEDAIGIPLYQQINMRTYRDWISGYVPNAMLTDEWEDLKRIAKKIPPE
jgi:peptide/nickel transport system substrate-binding protein